MVFTGRGLTRQEVSPHRVSIGGKRRYCRRLFLDSGAYSLYAEHAQIKVGGADKDYSWFVGKKGKLSRRFREYLNGYADFVTKYRKSFDHYASVDVIFNPELSWQAFQYLVDKGLDPVPVIHQFTPLSWLDRYVQAGCSYIGVGGFGIASGFDWGDRLFDHVCPKPDRLPEVKLHGFAITRYPMMVRWPWYSLDSARWAKAAGFGSILIPHKRRGEFTFEEAPYMIAFSHRSNARKVEGRHIDTVSPAERKIILEWLDWIGVPLGRVDKDYTPVEYGVASQYNARAVANLKFFEALAAWLPKWPWPLRVNVRRGLFRR